MRDVYKGGRAGSGRGPQSRKRNGKPADRAGVCITGCAGMGQPWTDRRGRPPLRRFSRAAAPLAAVLALPPFHQMNRNHDLDAVAQPDHTARRPAVCTCHGLVPVF